MTLDEYIQKSKQEYPNGYSDYIKANPEETIEAWIQMWAPDTVRVFKEYTFDRGEVSIMDLWELEKFHTFMGGTEYQFNQII